MSLGGESYLNFMGNEFGHPEWIDFPRDDTYDTSTGAFVPGAELQSLPAVACLKRGSCFRQMLSATWPPAPGQTGSGCA